MNRVIAFAFLVACGLALLVYPQAQDWYKEVFTEPVDLVYLRDETVLSSADAAFAEALEYNQRISDIPTGALNPNDYLTDADYLKQLAIPGTDAIAQIYIPRLGINLPIYHGTGEYALSHGVGHLYGTSLPVGGATTHAALTAHAGIPGSDLFTGLHDLEVGDEFTITAAGRPATYRVVDIVVVTPDEVSALEVQKEKDLVTLITCTPIGINSHRLLVTGERTDDPVQPTEKTSKWQFPWWAAEYAGGLAIAIVGGRKLLGVPKSQPKANVQ